MFTNGLGWPHLLIVALIFVLLFGAKRLPEGARALGKSLRIFKEETQGLTRQHHGQDPPRVPAEREDPGSPAAPNEHGMRQADQV